jgi:hypothetical protein
VIYAGLIVHLLGYLTLHQDLFVIVGGVGLGLLVYGWIGFACCTPVSPNFSAETTVMLGGELIPSSDGEQMAKRIVIVLVFGVAAQGMTLVTGECPSAGVFCVHARTPCAASPLFDTPFELAHEGMRCAMSNSSSNGTAAYMHPLQRNGVTGAQECVEGCLEVSVDWPGGAFTGIVEYGPSSGCYCVRAACTHQVDDEGVSVYKTAALPWTFGGAIMCAFGGGLFELFVVVTACPMVRLIECEVRHRKQ